MPAAPLPPQSERDPGCESGGDRPAVPPRPPVTRPAPVRFGDLAGDAAEVEIEHAGQIYRLRRTRAGKLLLTK